MEHPQTPLLLQQLYACVRTITRPFAELVRQTLRLTHVRRWAAMDLTLDEWDERTIKMAGMIPPGSTVLEFGAGRMVLRDHLPPECKYIPVDVVEREPGMMVCDLNARNLPQFPMHGVAFFSGVLEYVYDVPRILRALPKSCSDVIASYACSDRRGQSRRATRMRQGWVNHFTSDAFITLFRDAGFTCAERGRCKSHDLFKFVRLGFLNGGIGRV